MPLSDPLTDTLPARLTARNTSFDIGPEPEGPEHEVMTIPVDRPHHFPPESAFESSPRTPAPAERDATIRPGASIAAAVRRQQAANHAAASSPLDRPLSPPPPPQVDTQVEAVPPLPEQYSPSTSPMLSSPASFKPIYGTPDSSSGGRQPTLAELAGGPLDDPLPPPPVAPFAAYGSSHQRNASLSSASSASSGGPSKPAAAVAGTPIRRRARQQSVDSPTQSMMTRSTSATEPPSRLRARTMASDNSDEFVPRSIVGHFHSSPDGGGATPTKVQPQQLPSSAMSSPTVMNANERERRGPNFPSTRLKRATSGLRQLSLPSTVAAQNSASALSDGSQNVPPSAMQQSFSSSVQSAGGAETPTTTTTRRHLMGGAGSQIPIHKSSHSPLTAGPRSAVERSAGSSLPVDNYFKRLSVLPVVPPTIEPLPREVTRFVDATRGILFALSQVHTALKQYILFILDQRISLQFNRSLEISGNSVTGLIRALDRYDTLSRKGFADAGLIRSVLAACTEGVTTFRRMTSVLQLQLKPLQQTADVRYNRTFLLSLYGSIIELSESWSLMAPHLRAVSSYLKEAEKNGTTNVGTAAFLAPGPPTVGQGPVDLAFVSAPITPYSPSPTDDRGGATPKATTTRLPRRRDAGSFSAKDVQQGAIQYAATTAPAGLETFQRSDLDRARLRFRAATSPLLEEDDGAFEQAVAEDEEDSVVVSSSKTTRSASATGSQYAEAHDGAGGANSPWTSSASTIRAAPLQWQQRQPPLQGKSLMDSSDNALDEHLLELVDKITMTSATVWASLLGEGLDEDIVHFQSQARVIDTTTSADTSVDSQQLRPPSSAASSSNHFPSTSNSSTDSAVALSAHLGDQLVRLRKQATQCDRLTGHLRATLQQCKASVEQAQLGYQTKLPPEPLSKLWEEANILIRVSRRDCSEVQWPKADLHFHPLPLQMIVQASTLIKSLSSDYAFSVEMTRTLGALTTACTEMMIHMHFLSPTKMKAAVQSAAASDYLTLRQAAQETAESRGVPAPPATAPPLGR